MTLRIESGRIENLVIRIIAALRSAHRRDGFTLIEVLAARAISSVIIGATVTLIHMVAGNFDRGTRGVNAADGLMLAVQRLARHRRQRHRRSGFYRSRRRSVGQRTFRRRHRLPFAHMAGGATSGGALKGFRNDWQRSAPRDGLADRAVDDRPVLRSCGGGSSIARYYGSRRQTARGPSVSWHARFNAA